MTLTDKLQLVASLGSVLGVIFLGFQIRESRRIAVVQNAITGIDSEYLLTLEHTLKERLSKFTDMTTWDAVISEEEGLKILANEPAETAMWNYLNWWERVAVGINMGAYNEPMLRRRYGSGLVRVYRRYEKIIDVRRREHRTMYSELEITATRWEHKYHLLAAR